MTGMGRAETSATDTPAATAASSPWLTLPVLMAGTFMIVLDFFVVYVALPSIQASLHASAGALEWVVAGYGFSFAVFLVTAGRLGDHVGRRRMFSTGMAGFVVTSAACGVAPDAAVLIVARLAQGVAAALISASVLAIIGVTYVGAPRARAISVYGVVMGVAAASGQVVGGLLIAANVAGLGWRTVFLINVPVGLAALAVTRRLVPESRAERASGLDLVGMVLAALVLVAVVLPLVQGRQLGWPAWAWGSLAASPVLFVLFLAHQRALDRRGGSPLLDLELFRVVAFRTGLLIQLVFWSTQAASFLILALYLQSGRGLDALHAGLVFTILAAAYVLTSVQAPALAMRFGPPVVIAGAAAIALGDVALLLAVTRIGVGGPIAVLAPGMVLVGAGQGLCVTPLTTMVLSHADGQRAGAVSGALSTMQQVGNSIGVAVTGVLFFGALAHGRGYAVALRWSLIELACLQLLVAALTVRLSRPPTPSSRVPAKPGPSGRGPEPVPQEPNEVTVTAPRRNDEDSDGGQFAVASVEMRSRRAWNRLQRRAVAGYEGEQLQLLSSLATASVRVLGLDVLTAHRWAWCGCGCRAGHSPWSASHLASRAGWVKRGVARAGVIDRCRPLRQGLVADPGRWPEPVTVLTADLRPIRTGGDTDEGTAERVGHRRPIEVDTGPVDSGRALRLSGGPY